MQARTSSPIDSTPAATPSRRNGDGVPIVALGARARSILRANAHGRVLALFRRSFYVAFGDDVVCVGALDIGVGPLAMLHSRHAPFDWRHEGIDVDAEAVCENETLAVGRKLRFDFARARAWRPPVATAHSVAALRAGLPLLGAAARQRSLGGLGALLPALCVDALPASFDSEDPVVRAAAPTIHALLVWLKAALGGEAPAPPAVAPLVGLGGGLTPSGDDFLGGALVALHYLGRSDLARVLARPVLACAPTGTSAISAAYLRCACAGEGFAALFDALDGVLAGAGARLEAPLDAIAAIGHTSGWDCLAGSLAVCGALAHARGNATA